MCTRNLLRICTKFKNSPVLIHRVNFYNLTNAKKVIDENKILGTKNFKEELPKELQSSLTSQTIYSDDDIENLQGPHIITALLNVHKKYKIKRNDDITDNNKSTYLDNDDALKKLCAIISLKINELSVLESMQILNIISFYTYSKYIKEENQGVVKSLLLHISDSIDEFEFKDFCMLYRILKRLPSSPLNYSVQSSLLKKFLFKITMDFDENNIRHILYALEFASQFKDHNELVKILLKKLESCDDISLEKPLSILTMLYSIKLDSEYLHLVTYFQNKVINNIHAIGSGKTIKFIQTMFYTIRHTNLNVYYNPDLLDKLIQNVIKKDIGFEGALDVLKGVSNMNHLNRQLLNYACASFFERKILGHKEIKDLTKKLLVLIEGLSRARHKTIFWTEMEEYILNCEKLLDYDYQTLCITAANLISLNCYHIGILEKIFNNNLDFTSNLFLSRIFCRIYQKLATDPNYKGPMPTELQLKALEKKQKNIVKGKKLNKKLLCHLEEGMGAPIYVRSNISTKYFHVLDHVVVFDKNGVPVPLINNTAHEHAIDELSNSIDYIENFEIPSDSQIVIVILCPEQWYFRNDKELLLSWRCDFIESLQNQSYTVVPINESIWNQTPDDKKTTVLMDKIKSKINCN